MKTPLISTFALLSLLGTVTTAGAQTPLGYTPIPGYDRPSIERVHQHVVYWNDSMDHYDLAMQTAADAYSDGDMKEKKHKKSEMQYDHKKPKHK